MRKLAFYITVVVAASACSTGATTSTVGSTTTDTRVSPQTTSTTTLPTSTTPAVQGNVSLIVARLGGVTLFESGQTRDLPGDADYPVAVAFDDLSGGLVYQYQTTPEQFPPHSVLHIAAGTSSPEVVLFAEWEREIRLLDVEEVDGRTTLLFLEGAEGVDPDTLLMADIAGGAPKLIVRADASAPPTAAGVSPTVILGGSLSDTSVAVVWGYGDLEADCSYVEVLDFDGATVFGPIPDLCGEQDLTHATLSADGSQLAYAGEGVVGIVDVISGEILGEWATADIAGLDFDGTTALVTGVDEYSAFSASEPSAVTQQLPPATTHVIAGRGPVDIVDGTFLGGVRTLSVNCSAAGMSRTPEEQGGLPEAVAVLRDSIVAAATSCDIDSLAALGGDTVAFSFGGDPDAGRFWRWSEQEGYSPLARMVDVLALPFVIQDSPGGRIYTWPSAFQEFPTDEDWQALAGVFNEEDIDLFKEYGAYIGMRVGITEDGTWLFAIEGD